VANSDRSGVERTAPGNGKTLLLGVKSLEELAAECPPNRFCGGDVDDVVVYDGCGYSDTLDLDGPGWWINNLQGAATRVHMYNERGRKVYTTPPAPSKDMTADWTGIFEIQTCV
jgi:hypothetical protein